MRLHYYKFGTNRFPEGTGNFGDDLNPWLWDQLLPGVLDQDKSILFVGIGTLLGKYLPKAKRTIVFGSGACLGKPLPRIDETWTIYALRGPLSASALGVDPALAVTDAAMLLRRVWSVSETKRYRFGLMPHVLHVLYERNQVWKEICEALGFCYLDPRYPVEETLALLSETEVLITEAMHGAIAADALRVPWIPIATDATVNRLKWQDWCSSLNLIYDPHYLLPPAQAYPLGPGIRSSLQYGATWFQQSPLRSLQHLGMAPQQRAIAELQRISQATPLLSDEAQLELRVTQLEEKLHQFRQDVATGQFNF